MGTTALAEAEAAARIIKVYGEDGSRASEEVINELKRVNDHPAGSSVLADYLRKWERAHP